MASPAPTLINQHWIQRFLCNLFSFCEDKYEVVIVNPHLERKQQHNNT